MTSSNQSSHHSFSFLASRHALITTLSEGAKIIYHLIIFTAFSPHEAALVGTMFSLAYLSAQTASLEGGSALVPFLPALIAQPRPRWSLAWIFLLPQLIQHAFGALMIYHGSCSGVLLPSHLALLTACLAFTEGIRGAARPLAYTLGNNLTLAVIEMSITIWSTTNLFFFISKNPSALITAYLANSIVGTCVVLAGLFLQAKKRESLTHSPQLPALRTRLHAQIMLICTHLPKNLISENLLVPLLFVYAGDSLTKVAKIVAATTRSFKSIFASLFSLPLAIILHRTHAAQQASIHQLLPQLRTIIMGMMTVGIIIITVFSPQMPHLTMIISAFVIATLAEYTWLAYEQFFIMGKHFLLLALIRGSELILCGVAVLFMGAYPTGASVSIAAFKSISLFIAHRMVARTL